MISKLDLALADQADVLTLAALAARSDPDAWSAAQIQSTVQAQAKSSPARRTAVWLCRDKGGHAVLGFAAWQSVLDEAELLYVVVDGFQRGQGIGRRLLEGGLQYWAANGIEHCFLEVRKSNVSAQKLYSALGFSVFGARKAYYVHGQHGPEDALLMRCQLGKEPA